VRLSPQHTAKYAGAVVSAGVDILVIQGTVVSAEYVSGEGEHLNLKTYVSSLDVPVIVGGCTDYQTALHLMRTGAAGVIVGYGSDDAASTHEVLGIGVPMATAIAEAAAARRDYLDETGGRYVHVIADGELVTSGDVARALACGADAVMMGRPLRLAQESPSAGQWWPTAAAHPKLPRGRVEKAPDALLPLEQLLFGPARTPDGDANIFGALRRVMAKSGYDNLKEFQKVGLVIS
jgi:IMP dehydrogenase